MVQDCVEAFLSCMREVLFDGLLAVRGVVDKITSLLLVMLRVGLLNLLSCVLIVHMSVHAAVQIGLMLFGRIRVLLNGAR